MDGNDTGLSLGEWALLVLILMVGLGYALWSALIGMALGQEQVTSFAVPGEVRFEIERPGSYLIYHEVQRSADSKDVLRPPGLKQLRFALQHVESGDRIALEDAENEASFAIRRSLAESLYRFTAERSGTYLALGHYDDAQMSGEFQFVVAQDFRQQLIGGLRRAAVAALATCVAVGLLAFRAMRRGRKEVNE